MASQALLRTISHHYIQRQTRNGPFRLQFADFHASNIFVDKDGNIRYLIDHEWVYALPTGIISVPYWLTGCAIDGITNKKLDEFKIVHQEFMNIFEEEVKITATNLPVITLIVHDSWKTSAVWFWHYITSVNAAWSLVEDHIGPRFIPISTDTKRIFSQYWCQGSSLVATRKVTEREKYVKELKALFDEKAGLSTEEETHG